MAEVVEPPKVRYTQDSQTAITEVLVEFEGLRPDDPRSRLKVVGWGNMAQTLQQECQIGGRYVIEGRLRISTYDRPEGLKEKVVELTAINLHPLGSGVASPQGIPSNTVPFPSPMPPPPAPMMPPPGPYAPPSGPDHIPF